MSLLATLMICAIPRDTEAAVRLFGPGDLFVTLQTGEIQWRHADGSLEMVLVNTIPGKAEGMTFDAALNLYVAHHCADGTCLTGNMVERFNSSGISMGRFGTGYNCNPNSLVFDASRNLYVGQLDCTSDILQLNATGSLMASIDAATEARGTDWIDMGRDGCTMLYTSSGPDVMRYNVCAKSQMGVFNMAPIASGESHGLKVLNDGGALVATANDITRLDASGNVVRTYDVAGEPDLWLGLDLVGDGTFWASNYGSSDVVRFDLTTGSVLASFNTGTPTLTVKSVAVVRPPTLVAQGRMTGGGSIFTDTGMRVTHGFELHCDASQGPNNLEVNWGPGDRFHLESLTFAECSDDPTITPTPPPAPFDTYHGAGTGKLDGVDGATAEWTLTDAGEPGTQDTFSLTVKDADGNVVLSFSQKRLTYGNHQAHK
jgi:hypothetical protein